MSLFISISKIYNHQEFFLKEERYMWLTESVQAEAMELISALTYDCLKNLSEELYIYKTTTKQTKTKQTNQIFKQLILTSLWFSVFIPWVFTSAYHTLYAISLLNYKFISSTPINL